MDGYYNDVMDEDGKWSFLWEESEYRNTFIPNDMALTHFKNNTLIEFFISEFKARDTTSRYTMRLEKDRVFFTDSHGSMLTLIVGRDHFQIDFDLDELLFSAVYESSNPARSYYWKHSGILTAPALAASMDIVFMAVGVDKFRC